MRYRKSGIGSEHHRFEMRERYQIPELRSENNFEVDSDARYLIVYQLPYPFPRRDHQ